MWVYDKAAWTAGKTHIEVRISTSNKVGFIAYNDAATLVDLVRDDKGKGGKGEPWFWTDSQLLVSNEVDDKYESAEYLGLDEAPPIAPIPQPKHGYTWLASDRTHRIALGGKVKAVYIDGTGNSFEKEAPAKAKHTVNLNVHILLDNKATAGGKAVIQKTEVENHITRMQESFAQIGIQVKKTINDQEEPPVGVDLSNGFQYDHSGGLTDEETNLLADSEFQTRTNAGTRGRNAIEVYYINYFADSKSGDVFLFGDTAYARTGARTSDIKYADSIIMRVDRDAVNKGGVLKYTTLAHESGHLLENFAKGINEHYPYQGTQEIPTPPAAIDTVNLMVTGSKAETTGIQVIDSRRLVVEQDERMNVNRSNLLVASTK